MIIISAKNGHTSIQTDLKNDCKFTNLICYVIQTTVIHLGGYK